MSFLNVAAIFVIGACASPAVLPPRVPSAAQAEETVVLEGTMEVLIEDAKQGSRILYFLISGERRVPLRFMSPPTKLPTGARVRVRGHWAEDGALVVTTVERI